MFNFIFFNVFEIFVVITIIAVVGVLIFAMRYRMKHDQINSDEMTLNTQTEAREVGLMSAGIAQSYKSKGSDESTDS